MSNTKTVVVGDKIPKFKEDFFGCWWWSIGGSTPELRLLRRKKALVDVGAFIFDVGKLVGHKSRVNGVVQLDNLIHRSFLRLSDALERVEQLSDEELLLILEQSRRDGIAARERFNALQSESAADEEEECDEVEETPVELPVSAPAPGAKRAKAPAPAAEPAHAQVPAPAREAARSNPKRAARAAAAAARAAQEVEGGEPPARKRQGAAQKPRRRVREMAEA